MQGLIEEKAMNGSRLLWQYYVFAGVSAGEGEEEAERRVEGVNENLRRVIGFASKGKADNAVRHEDEVMLEFIDLRC